MRKVRKRAGVCPSALSEKETQGSAYYMAPEVTTSRLQFQSGWKLSAISISASWRRLSRPHATSSVQELHGVLIFPVNITPYAPHPGWLG